MRTIWPFKQDPINFLTSSHVISCTISFYFLQEIDQDLGNFLVINYMCRVGDILEEIREFTVNIDITELADARVFKLLSYMVPGVEWKEQEHLDCRPPCREKVNWPQNGESSLRYT